MSKGITTPATRLPTSARSPAFPEGLPLARPKVADGDAVVEDVRRILDSGVLTNGPYTRKLEDLAAEYLGVRHCLAVSSCTTGLMLLIRAADLSGDVVVPSFTFFASAHAIAWNGLRPVFADIDPWNLTLSPEAAMKASGVRASAILATHTYGTPCDIARLTAVAQRSGIRLFFDAAHAFGSRYRGTPVGGFGDAEVFSLSPTKPLIAGEGGIIATNDDLLAERCRMGRDYGNPGDYDCKLIGLNARMSEFHAAVALASFADLEERILRRNDLATAYKEALAGLPGISFPEIRAQDRSTYKDFTIIIDPREFGLDADRLAGCLQMEGIETRRYYSPPIHRTTAYRFLANANGDLPVTDIASSRVLSLPLWVGMTDADVALVREAIARLHA